MESNFNNKDFEQFVKQNADQYRMFPSEKVWKDIHNRLHTRRKWYGLGLVLLMLTTGSVTWVMLSSSGKGQPVPNKSTFISPISNSSIEQKEQANLVSNKTTKIFTGIDDNWQKDLSASNVITTDNNDKVVPSNAIKDRMEGNNIGILATQRLPVGSSPTISLVNKQPVYYVMNNNLEFSPIVADNFSPSYIDKTTDAIINEIKTAENNFYPLSIESVTNVFNRKMSRKKLSWEIYFTPTISYRKLAENKAFLSSPMSNNSPYSYAAIYDVNSAVTHKPDMGFEMGFSAGYPLTSNIKIIGGLQFNVSKYDIKAFTTYPTELATIALNTGSGSRSAVSTPTNYRNFGGYSQNWLHNFYLSASAPFGAELKIKGDNKTYLGVAGTIQPTYILGDKAYMISTDYKNYAEVPQLIRRWNVGTSFEAFASYSTGKINWKVGPQVRYQLLSSFEKRYPVKEHIFDFGLKVGMMLHQ